MQRILLLTRFGAYICGTGVICWLLITAVQDVLGLSNSLNIHNQLYDLAQNITLPSPVVVRDKRGRTRWTVSIPSSLALDLEAEVYTDICAKSEDLARQLGKPGGHGGYHDRKGISSYYHTDKSFMDVDEAEAQGLIPVTTTDWARNVWKPVVDWSRKGELHARRKDLKDILGEVSGRVCDRSLTYVMEASDAGFGETLMGLWMSYGLAKIEDRTFFIDDSNWYQVLVPSWN